MLVCPQCHTPNQPGSRFCQQCGKTLVQPGSVDPGAKTMVQDPVLPDGYDRCLRCKHPLRTGFEFCLECGKVQRTGSWLLWFLVWASLVGALVVYTVLQTGSVNVLEGFRHLLRSFLAGG